MTPKTTTKNKQKLMQLAITPPLKKSLSISTIMYFLKYFQGKICPFFFPLGNSSISTISCFVFVFCLFSFREGKETYWDISCKSKEKMEQRVNYKQIEWWCYKNYLRKMPTHSHVTKDLPFLFLSSKEFTEKSHSF